MNRLLCPQANVGQIYYHTAMCLLAQMHPRISPKSKKSKAIRTQARKHSDELCGILIHTKDKAVFSVTLRCLYVAAATLQVRAKQEEIMALLDKVRRECGWKGTDLKKELQKTWGWSPAEAPSSKEVEQTSKFDSSEIFMVNISKESQSKEISAVYLSYPVTPDLRGRSHFHSICPLPPKVVFIRSFLF
jgi:hypothetical protein